MTEEQLQERHQKTELIYIMLDLGYRILVVENRIYAVKEFSPAEETGAYNSLNGQDITKILESFPNFRNLDKNQVDKLAQKLTSAQQVKMNFSNHHKWKLYHK